MEIIKINSNWKDILKVCRATVGKENLNKEPSEAFKKEIMLSEHSPIREWRIRFEAIIPSFVATHLARHSWECYIESLRDDRTDKIDNDRETLVRFNGSMNAQNLIDTFRKRLCTTSHIKTMKLARELKALIHNHEPILADMLVPNCVYRCGCPEGSKDCGFFDRKYKDASINDLINIKNRYSIYNK